MQTPELVKVYTEKAAKALRDAIEKSAPKKKTFVGEGEFEVVATTEGVDRDGEVIKVSAWDFTNFQKSPVLLWGHDYGSLPIGAVTDIRVEGTSVIAKGVFARSEFAQEVRALYDDGFVKTVSVGFIPHERNGAVITKAELLELSFVSVPANPDALDRLKSFESKYLNLEVKIQEEEKPVAEEPKQEETPPTDDTQKVPVSLIAEYPTSDGTEKSYAVEEKAGRVLSQKNRIVVQDAINALQALLDASETPEKDVQEQANQLKKTMQTIVKAASYGLANWKEFERKL
jgi:HK97 family phage prohead protease